LAKNAGHLAKWSAAKRNLLRRNHLGTWTILPKAEKVAKSVATTVANPCQRQEYWPNGPPNEHAET
jgi:hypothetical protein